MLIYMYMYISQKEIELEGTEFKAQTDGKNQMNNNFLGLSILPMQ